MLFQSIKPMLLHKSELPPEGEFIHQLKYDGFRCLLHMDSTKVNLFTRHQNNCTSQFPEFSSVTLRAESAILDGEMIVLGDDGKPDFERVMSRFQSTRRSKPIPAHFAAFDVVYMDGQSVMHLPLEKRLELLQELVVPSDLISVVPFQQDGEKLFARVKELSLEGIVSKRLGSKYRLDTRSHDWLKTKNYQYATVAISGIRKGEFGWSLQLEDGSYAGVCEFAPQQARQAFFQIAKQIVKSENKNWIYLDPLIKCRVKYQCTSKKRLLRSPSFVEFVHESK